MKFFTRNKKPKVDPFEIAKKVLSLFTEEEIKILNKKIGSSFEARLVKHFFCSSLRLKHDTFEESLPLIKLLVKECKKISSNQLSEEHLDLFTKCISRAIFND